MRHQMVLLLGTMYSPMSNGSGLRKLDESLAGLTGGTFFRQLARTLAFALRTHCTFVYEFIEDNTRAKPLAGWLDGRFVDFGEFVLAGTPCERVLTGMIVTFDSDVQELFPAHRHELAAVRSKSYVEMPMRSHTGQVIGHIAAIDSCDRDWADTDLGVLELCASRASGEL